jgi:signal transduction histidine kinase
MAPLAWTSGRVEVAAQLPERLPRVLCDEQRLDQILTNLLRNAVHHTLPGGLVVVSASVQPDTVSFEVRDTGSGIDPEDLPHIWDRFYRGRRTQGAPAGAGLGLALVKELVEAMGGAVGAESTVGQGSRFSFDLPRAQAG